MYLITILFKSGNTLKIKAKEFEVVKNGQDVEKIRYVLRGGKILHIDVTQIEAVTSQEAWF